MSEWDFSEEHRRQFRREDEREAALADRISRLEALWASDRETWTLRLQGLYADAEEDEWFLKEAEWTRQKLCEAAMDLDDGVLAGFLDEMSSTDSTITSSRVEEAKKSQWRAGREAALFTCLEWQADSASAEIQLAHLLDAR